MKVFTNSMRQFFSASSERKILIFLCHNLYVPLNLNSFSQSFSTFPIFSINKKYEFSLHNSLEKLSTDENRINPKNRWSRKMYLNNFIHSHSCLTFIHILISNSTRWMVKKNYTEFLVIDSWLQALLSPFVLKDKKPNYLDAIETVEANNEWKIFTQ